MATYVVGARKPSQEILLSTQNIGVCSLLVSIFFSKLCFQGRQVLSYLPIGCEDYLRFDSTGTRMMIKNIWNTGKKKSARAGNRLTITL